MFDGFTRAQIETHETTINLVRGGSGYPILLLHGYPQTHVCWHLVVPRLAKRFTFVCPDLRGYGDSAKPPSDPKHLAYSKRVMAREQVEVMQSLGFSEFAVVGHDRGARVAHRMALDQAHKEKKISCPTLLLWSATSWARFDMLEVWRARAEDVQGVAFDCGHFLSEENPQRTAAELMRFFS